MVTSKPLMPLLEPAGSVPYAFVNLVAMKNPTSYLPAGSGRPRSMVVDVMLSRSWYGDGASCACVRESSLRC